MCVLFSNYNYPQWMGRTCILTFLLGRGRNELEEKVSRERQLGIVLEALESREKFRMKRIEEVKKMMHQLR